MDEDEGYLASVSDLMVGMLFVFILMLMAFALSYRSAQSVADTDHEELLDAMAELDSVRAYLASAQDAMVTRRDVLEALMADVVQRQQARMVLLATLQWDLLERSVPVTVDAANGILRLSESLLFDSGVATLRPAGEHALAELAAVLLEILPCVTLAPVSLTGPCRNEPTPLLQTLLVEGHTDAEPIRGGVFADNWELATARSIGVFKALIAFAPALENLRNQDGEALLGVSGYEARRPVTSATGEEAQRQNRRIDLRFVLAGPSEADIDRVRRRLEALKDQ
ncbi:MAG: hypothetical protein WAS21_22130 [Geminicoccaceae bacterium]